MRGVTSPPVRVLSNCLWRKETIASKTCPHLPMRGYRSASTQAMGTGGWLRTGSGRRNCGCLSRLRVLSLRSCQCCSLKTIPKPFVPLKAKLLAHLSANRQKVRERHAGTQICRAAGLFLTIISECGTSCRRLTEFWGSICFSSSPDSDCRSLFAGQVLPPPLQRWHVCVNPKPVCDSLPWGWGQMVRPNPLDQTAVQSWCFAFRQDAWASYRGM